MTAYSPGHVTDYPTPPITEDRLAAQLVGALVTPGASLSAMPAWRGCSALLSNDGTAVLVDMPDGSFFTITITEG